MIQRKKFLDIFSLNSDDSLTPKHVIKVNGVTFGTGVTFAKGVSFGGVDFHKYQSFDLAVEKKGSILVIRGFYENGT